jgi:hypothetical protein
MYGALRLHHIEDRTMKIMSLVVAGAATLLLAVASAAQGQVIRDHRGGYQPYKPPGTPLTASCPGGIAVNGKCTTTVKPPECHKPRHGSGWKPPCYRG